MSKKLLFLGMGGKTGEGRESILLGVLGAKGSLTTSVTEVREACKISQQWHEERTMWCSRGGDVSVSFFSNRTGRNHC